ncbi:MAG: hypothetical protein N4A71_19255 [Carboxylicivirga sp.]|nr:hypothetical protein [Carboxylicivirga sp.]
MKLIKTVIACLFILCLSGMDVKAQKGVLSILNASPTDAKILGEGYLAPYSDMIASSLLSGWNTTARIQRFGKLNLSLGATYTMVPNGSQNFEVADLKTVQLKEGSTVPTMAGAGKTSFMAVPGQIAEDFTLIGEEINAYVSPSFSFSVGLPYHTEFLARCTPTANKSDYDSYLMWGAGVKHSFKSYIPSLRRLPYFNAAILVNYSSLVHTIVNEKVINGLIDTRAQALSGRMIVSADFPLIGFYGGAGVGEVSSDFNVKADAGETITTKEVKISNQTQIFDVVGGMKLNYGIFSVNMEYSTGIYSTFSLGLSCGLSYKN